MSFHFVSFKTDYSTLNSVYFYSIHPIDRYVILDASDKKALLNEITKVIRSERLENIFDLTDYIIKHGSEIGVSSLAVLNEVLSGNTGLIKLYFDGAYQRGKRLKIDEDTGEII